MTVKPSGEVWVCTDCYFAHHYGVRATVTGTDHLDPRPVPLDEVPGLIAEGWTVTWWSGDTPCDREPLGELDGLDLYDNTCSNHYYGQSPDHGEDDVFGTYTEPCDYCGERTDENGIHEFSWAWCEGCGSTLGGSRYRLHWEER